MRARFLFSLVLGHLATFFWFFPPFSKLLHKLRGVKFRNSSSVFISKGVLLDNKFPELITIDEDVWLTQGVTVLSHSSCSRLQTLHLNMLEVVGEVVIKRGVFIGVKSIVLPGVTLGEYCYIGAGSVVTTDIPPRTLAAGNPCRVVRVLNGSPAAQAQF